MLLQASNWFGVGKQFENEFPMFKSDDYNYLGRQNVLFNDATKALVDVGARDRYYTWIGRYFVVCMISHFSFLIHQKNFEISVVVLYMYTSKHVYIFQMVLLI